MEIRIKKGKEDVHALSCTREDGTSTWSKLKGHYGPAHDLAHYVVETSLGSMGGFYGLLMQGHNITDFETREDRTWIGEEGLYIECVVMAVQYIATGVDEQSAFNAMVDDACQRQNIPSRPALSASRIAEIIARYQTSLQRWNQLQPGESVLLSFPDRKLQVPD